jgi:hypothetical protein
MQTKFGSKIKGAKTLLSFLCCVFCFVYFCFLLSMPNVTCVSGLSLWFICTRPTHSYLFTVKAHWNNSPLVEMSHNSDTLSWILCQPVFTFNHKCHMLSREAAILDPRSTPHWVSMLTFTIPRQYIMNRKQVFVKQVCGESDKKFKWILYRVTTSLCSYTRFHVDTESLNRKDISTVAAKYYLHKNMLIFIVCLFNGV